MIILDTNVVSEVMKSEPNPRVRDWLNNQSLETLYLSSVTVAELLFGLEVLPEGARKNSLSRSIETTLQYLTGRILPFDHIAARRYAQIALTARQAGRPLATADGYIAATASVAGLRIATRNIRDFQDCGVDLIDPWQEFRTT